MDDVAAEMERERQLKRKREREAAEAAANPFAAMADEVSSDNEADAVGGDEEEKKPDTWASVKDKKEQRAAHVEQLKKKVRGNGGSSSSGGDDASAPLPVTSVGSGADVPSSLSAEDLQAAEAEQTLLDEANALRAQQVRN